MCAALTRCGSVDAESYEWLAPTPLRDRVCSRATLCKYRQGLQYESARLTPTSDRVCAPLTRCEVLLPARPTPPRRRRRRLPFTVTSSEPLDRRSSITSKYA